MADQLDLTSDGPEITVTAPEVHEVDVQTLPAPVLGVTAPDPFGVLTVVPVPGPAGRPGASGAGFEHVQDSPASVWTVQHGLHRQPVSVAVYSRDFAVQWDGFVVQPLDPDTCRISFDDPLDGVALIL